MTLVWLCLFFGATDWKSGGDRCLCLISPIKLSPCVYFQALENVGPGYPKDCLNPYFPAHSLRSFAGMFLVIPWVAGACLTTRTRGCSAIGPVLWNTIPMEIQWPFFVPTFKSMWKTFLFCQAYGGLFLVSFLLLTIFFFTFCDFIVWIHTHTHTTNKHPTTVWGRGGNCKQWCQKERKCKKIQIVTINLSIYKKQTNPKQLVLTAHICLILVSQVIQCDKNMLCWFNPQVIALNLLMNFNLTVLHCRSKFLLQYSHTYPHSIQNAIQYG